ncbi:MAG: hypothetical protein M1830_001635 [Pleopsidium flavum]|nr:MAG: hypothetical protein M1830_001635 [Pleopsidium flavum]
MKDQEDLVKTVESPMDGNDEHSRGSPTTHHHVSSWRVVVSILLLFLNYFLAQYDKFILSYFQTDVISTLKLSSSEYGILSGYATGIVYAVLALPTAFTADFTEARILLARIGMGIGQAPVEALSVSLISDLVGTQWIFLAESCLYIGVYLGEAVSGQIATAFTKTKTPWNSALKAIGIVGVVIAVLIRILLREPARRSSLVRNNTERMVDQRLGGMNARFGDAKFLLTSTFGHVLRMESFWLLTLCSGARQLSGNVFGYYMPGYLTAIYPSETDLLSTYGIIVGSVGSVTVVCGGLLSAYLEPKTIMTPLYITSIGGMISSVFVILMVLSRSIAGQSETNGVKILYGSMVLAYATAELWLGAWASLLALLLPPRMKTFALAIYTSVITLIYSSGPQIIGLALRKVDPASSEYIERTKLLLAVIIPVGYWTAGIGLLLCISKVKKDVNGKMIPRRGLETSKKIAFGVFAFLLAALVIALFVTSLVYR